MVDMARAEIETTLEALAATLLAQLSAVVEEPDAVTVGEAAEWLDVSRSTLYRLMRSGEVPSFTIGSRRLIPASSIHRLIGRFGAPTDPPGEAKGFATHARAPKPPVSQPPAAARATEDTPAPAQPAPVVKRHLRALPTPPVDPEAAAEAPAVTLQTMDEAAALLQCSKARVRAMLRDGRLTPVAVGRRVFVPARELEALLAGSSSPRT